MASAVITKRSKSVVGYGFHPTDQELVGHFLMLKITNVNFDMPIADVKVCDFEPWELPGQSKIKSSDRVWFFFYPRDFKYAKSRRSNRKTKAGFWKPTGKIREVKRKKKVIGTKRSLVFYRKEERTKWVMHEYELPNNKGDFLVCKLKDKRIGKTDLGEPKMATAAVSPSESGITVNSNCVEGELSEHTGSHVEDHNLNDISAASTSDRGEQICFDFFPNQNEWTPDSACNEHNLNEMIVVASNGGERSFPMPFELGNPEQIESPAYSGFGEIELGYDLAPQTPDETTAAAMSSYETDETSCIATSGIRNPNSDWRSYVLVSEEGTWSSPAENSDHGNQGACAIAGSSTPSCGSESNAAEAKSFEFQGMPTFFDQVNSLFKMEYSLFEPEVSPKSAGFLPSGSEECLLSPA